MDLDFSPVIWPEETAPPDAINCTKCELHCQAPRVIWGEGNPHAPITIILDNPGAREDKEGQPFVCGTRQTLQKAAFEAGFTMKDLYVTYLLKCRPRHRYDKELARAACLPYLEQQIQASQPQLVFCMGNTAVQWFFNDMEAEVKKLRGSWHTIRNLPTLVAYHPLAIRRRPNLAGLFADDWAMLAQRFFQLQNL